MSARDPERHVVPCYRRGEGDPWFHFLHGDVPKHEIDFIYRAEVPDGPFTRQHYSHLARLMRYVEPHAGAGHAFVIGNLSRDDTQHEPGHGGLALVFGLRVGGACDPAGRPDPAFSHAIAAVDRALDADAIFAAATAFHARVLGDDASAAWYRAYARTAAREPPGTLALVLAGYVDSFRDLPRPAPSASPPVWRASSAPATGRLVFVHADDAPFSVVARAAARLAAVLYRSDLRWTAISTGREADLPDGLTVRFVAESAVGPGEPAETRRALSEIPEDEEAIARALLGAEDASGARPVAAGWRAPPPAPPPPPGPPAPRSPIPVSLPLVSPPPAQETLPPPPAPRALGARIAAACIALAVAAGVYVLFGGSPRPPAPEPPVPPLSTAVVAPIAPPPPAEPAPTPQPEPPPPATAAPPQQQAAQARPAAPARATSSRGGGRCGVLEGKPCF